MANPAVLTLAASGPAPAPVAGLRDNQAAVSLALQFKVPPLLLMVTVWGAGLVAPWVAVKESAAGLAPRVGGTVDDGGGDDDAGLMSCASPGISDARRDIERPAGGVLAPIEAFAVAAPAFAVAPDNKL